jgi:clan AA aspartic protease
MKGVVNGRQPRVDVVIILSDGRKLAVEFVIDTGFDGFLALPATVVAALSLPSLGKLDAIMADGSRRQASVHTTDIVWNGVQVSIEVLAMGARPLLGTALLEGYTLIVPFVDGATVMIDVL